MPASPSSVVVADRLDAFEAELASDPRCDYRVFLPPRGSVEYLRVLRELIRIDIETSWKRGAPRRLVDYLDRHPEVRADAEALHAVAFEEYRARHLAGNVICTDEYELFGIDTSDWELEDDLPATQALAPPTDAMPRAMEPAHEEFVFPGFHILNELGRGAFGRVFLARQGELASRLVVLKVAADIAGESQTLAQLQHTNIVPVYSFHRGGGCQAVCMPFFGATTLAQVLQTLRGTPSLPNSGGYLRSVVSTAPSDSQPEPEASETTRTPTVIPTHETWRRFEQLSYVESILTLGAQLAEGLAHAHSHGILHCDLKPANVLLTDDGRPMLLDFNLAVDTTASIERAAVGGTLQYMAPEHIRAFRDRGGNVDARCDIFSLGMILYELLTGQHAFPVRKGETSTRVRQMLTDRQTPPTLRNRNAAVSPCVEAIVQKCLAAQPLARYQSATDLREDLERQLNNMPLKHAANPSRRERWRKWRARHPRLSSSASIGAVAAAVVVFCGLAAWSTMRDARTAQARNTFADHRTDFANAQVYFDDRSLDRQQAMRNFQAVLDRYGVPNDGGDGWLNRDDVARLDDAERAECRADIGEAFYLMAQLAMQDAAGRGTEVPADVEGWMAAAERYAQPRLPRALKEQKAERLVLANDPAAVAMKTEAAAVPLESPRDIVLVAMALTQSGRHTEALPHAIRATQIDSRNLSAWFIRGTIHQSLDQTDQALMCFGACLALRADFAPALFNRAEAFHAMGQLDQAINDVDRILIHQPGLPKALIARSELKDHAGDPAGAETDLTSALASNAVPVRAWFLRADFRQRRGDTAGAAADRAKGLSLTPTDELSWVGRAELRADASPTDALKDVEEALKIKPTSAMALQLKAHLLETLKKEDEALAVLNKAVKFHPDYAPVRAGRGVLLARKGDRTSAIRDARAAIRLDTRAPNAYQVACIYALSSKQNPADRTEALRLLWLALKTGFGLDMVDSDSDLDPIRLDREFQTLITDARKLNPAPRQK